MAGIVVEAKVLSGGMWPSAVAATFLPSTLHRMVPPVLALKTLLQVRDVYADAAGDAPDGKVEVDGSIGGGFCLQANHEGPPSRFLMGDRTVEPCHVGDGKI